MQPKLVVFSLAMIALLTLSALGQESGGDYSEPEMLRIQGGTFRMKGDQPKDVDHTVGVSGFKMGKYEVSNQEYKKFKPGHTGAWSKLDNPVESVTWDDAQAYCRWLSEKTGKSYRLPTEAEWEYACRAGSTTDYYWGENSNGKASGNPNINDFAWCDANSGEAAHPVGQKKPNDWGLYDMSGNVIEWCSDWYSGNYYGESPKNDPQGPLDGTERVLRGSEFRESGESCQSGWRFQTPPNTRDKGLGFRLVLDEMPRVGTPSEVGTSLEVGAPVTVNRGGPKGYLRT